MNFFDRSHMTFHGFDAAFVWIKCSLWGNLKNKDGGKFILYQKSPENANTEHATLIRTGNLDWWRLLTTVHSKNQTVVKSLLTSNTPLDGNCQANWKNKGWKEDLQNNIKTFQSNRFQFCKVQWLTWLKLPQKPYSDSSWEPDFVNVNVVKIHSGCEDSSCIYYDGHVQG